MPKIVPLRDPDERLDRIKEMFCKALGRELTAEEQRYLGLAAAAESAEQTEISSPEQKATPLRRAKGA